VPFRAPPEPFKWSARNDVNCHAAGALHTAVGRRGVKARVRLFQKGHVGRLWLIGYREAYGRGRQQNDNGKRC
jgi:hypothetical protein